MKGILQGSQGSPVDPRDPQGIPMGSQMLPNPPARPFHPHDALAGMSDSVWPASWYESLLQPKWTTAGIAFSTLISHAADMDHLGHCIFNFCYPRSQNGQPRALHFQLLILRCQNGPPRALHFQLLSSTLESIER